MHAKDAYIAPHLSLYIFIFSEHSNAFKIGVSLLGHYGKKMSFLSSWKVLECQQKNAHRGTCLWHIQ